MLAQLVGACDASCVCPQVELRVLMEPSWAVLEFELASALHGVIKKYWKQQRVQRDMLFRPNPQVRLQKNRALRGPCKAAIWHVAAAAGSLFSRGLQAANDFATAPCQGGVRYDALAF